MTMCGGRAADPLESRSRRMPRGSELRNYENAALAEGYELKEGPDEDRQATSRQVDGRTVDRVAVTAQRGRVWTVGQFVLTR